MSDSDSFNLIKTLLNKTLTDDYVQEWSDVIGRKREKKKEKELFKVLIFCLGEQQFAFATEAIHAVTEVPAIHKVPHKSNTYFEGIANQKGRLRLVASLFHLLALPEEKKRSLTLQAKMLMIKRGPEEWSFVVDEVKAIATITFKEIQNVPVTVAKSAVNFFKGIFYFQGEPVGILEEELIFSMLEQKAL